VWLRFWEEAIPINLDIVLKTGFKATDSRKKEKKK